PSGGPRPPDGRPDDGPPPPTWSQPETGPDATTRMAPIGPKGPKGKGTRKGTGVPKPKKSDLTPRQLVRRQRRRRRRILIGLAVLTIVVDLIVGFGTAYLRWRLGQIKRIDLPSLAAEDPDKPMNVLLVGSDSRARLSGSDAVQAGKDTVQGQRSDTIMVLHIDPTRQTGALLSIPRDLYLPIAGTTGSDRINSAFSLGGADALIATISQSLKIYINHYAEVDFVGFKDIIDAVGGVTVYVPHPARDLHSGLTINQTGCVNLNGTQGLAWVRSRFYEEQVGGQWRAESGSDLGRIQRQQDLLRKMATEAASEGKGNPLALNRLIGIGVENLTLDSALSTSDLTDLAKRLRNIDPDALETFTLPTTSADVNGASVLMLHQAEAKPIIDRINGVTNPEPAPTTTVAAGPTPAQIRMRVLNGIGVAGAASRAATAFTGAGFTVVERGDADASTYARTLVRYAPGQLPAAQFVQQSLAAGAELQEDRALTAADVAVVVGRDYTGLKGAAAAGSAVTATSLPASGAATTTPVVTGANAPTTVAVPTTTVRPAC
ncbi:MAG: LCP family protein, partial [Acidimicrobiales bacterium]